MFYKYVVQYYNEYDDSEISDEGIVFAESFGKAAERVAEEYGECAFEVTISETTVEENSYCFSKSDFDYSFKSN